MAYDTQTQPIERARTTFLGKTFGFMFIGLLISAAVAMGLSFGLANLYPNKTDGIMTAAVIMSVSGIAIIGFSIWISLASALSARTHWVPFILYAIAFGALLGCFVLITEIPTYLIGEALALTSATFGGMALAGLLSKRPLGILALIGSGLLMGIFTVALFGLVFFLFFPYAALWFDLLIDLGMIVVMLLFTAFDVSVIKQLSEEGETSNALALVCAFRLYTSFVHIFMRILMILARSRR